MTDITNLKSVLTWLIMLKVIACEELRKFSFMQLVSYLTNLFISADFLHVCRKSDSNLNECVYNSVKTLKPYLVTGIPEYDIPSLEPIDLGDLIVAGSKTGQGLYITVKDLKAFGASNWSLKNLK